MTWIDMLNLINHISDISAYPELHFFHFLSNPRITPSISIYYM